MLVRRGAQFRATVPLGSSGLDRRCGTFPRPSVNIGHRFEEDRKCSPRATLAFNIGNALTSQSETSKTFGVFWMLRRDGQTALVFNKDCECAAFSGGVPVFTEGNAAPGLTDPCGMCFNLEHENFVLNESGEPCATLFELSETQIPDKMMSF